MSLAKKITSNYAEWEEFHSGEINENGVIIKKIKNSSPVKFSVNLKHIIEFHPFETMKESTFNLYLKLLKEMSPSVDIDDDMIIAELKGEGIIK